MGKKRFPRCASAKPSKHLASIRARGFVLVHLKTRRERGTDFIFAFCPRHICHYPLEASKVPTVIHTLRRSSTFHPFFFNGVGHFFCFLYSRPEGFKKSRSLKISRSQLNFSLYPLRIFQRNFAVYGRSFHCMRFFSY